PGAGSGRAGCMVLELRPALAAVVAALVPLGLFDALAAFGVELPKHAPLAADGGQFPACHRFLDLSVVARITRLRPRETPRQKNHPRCSVSRFSRACRKASTAASSGGSLANESAISFSTR